MPGIPETVSDPALRFDLEESLGTNSPIFVGFRSETQRHDLTGTSPTLWRRLRLQQPLSMTPMSPDPNKTKLKASKFLSRNDHHHGSIFGGMLTFLGLATSILAVSSLIQDWGNISLGSYTADFMTFYREFASRAKWLLFDWWLEIFYPDFRLPIWAFDVLVLWSLSYTMYRQGNIAAMALTSSELGEVEYEDKPKNPSRLGRLLYLVFTEVRTFVLAPFVLVGRSREALKYASPFNPVVRRMLKGAKGTTMEPSIKGWIYHERYFLMWCIAPLFGSLVFFGLNALWV